VDGNDIETVALVVTQIANLNKAESTALENEQNVTV
jgi:hypothetical protein